MAYPFKVPRSFQDIRRGCRPNSRISQVMVSSHHVTRGWKGREGASLVGCGYLVASMWDGDCSLLWSDSRICSEARSPRQTMQVSVMFVCNGRVGRIEWNVHRSVRAVVMRMMYSASKVSSRL